MTPASTDQMDLDQDFVLVSIDTPSEDSVVLERAVSSREYLDQDLILLCIFSVTEAIRIQSGPQKGSVPSSLYSIGAWNVLRHESREHPDLKDGDTTHAAVARPRRTLYIPVLWSKNELVLSKEQLAEMEHLEKTLPRQEYIALQKAKAESNDRSAHWALVCWDLNPGDGESREEHDDFLPRPTVYNSATLWTENKGLHIPLFDQAKQMLERMGWYHEPQRREHIDFVNGQIKPSPQQSGAIECGFHVVLNVWSHALGLEADENFRANRSFYNHFATTANLAMKGLASSDDILKLLSRGYVKPGSQVQPGCHFARSVRLSSRAGLENRFKVERYRARYTATLLQIRGPKENFGYADIENFLPTHVESEDVETARSVLQGLNVPLQGDEDAYALKVLYHLLRKEMDF